MVVQFDREYKRRKKIDYFFLDVNGLILMDLQETKKNSPWYDYGFGKLTFVI